MYNFKTSLLTATAFMAVTGSIATAAQAQIVLPASELRGAGATSIQNVLVQSLNCVGRPGAGLNQLGNNSGQLSTIPAGAFTPTAPTAASPAYDCATQTIQPNFQGKYVATGSGFGRQMWRLFSNQFTGTATNTNPFGTWTNLEFAFSDTPAVASDITAYNANANSATNKAGPAIQFPLYVLPVALAYNPKYGTRTTAGVAVDLTYNVTATLIAKDSAGNPIGGLRLSRANYCKIFNGEITNWNDAALKTSNSNKSLMDADDDLARWNTEGVPIRLVGRLDKSGTTDIFTRHLAAVCTPLVTVNKFAKNSEALPYDPSSTINLTGYRADTPYVPGAPAANFAGTVQSISGAFFNRTTQTIVVGKGKEAPGKFMVADGSSGVRDAINFAPDKTSTVLAAVKLNGKLGYIGADFVKPSTGATLFAASLPKGTTTSYLMPNSTNAAAAMGTILPPQTTATSGAYNEADTRTNSVTGVRVNRANPLDWTDVLYSNPAQTLAAPTAGYAITGTTQFLGYTCYKTPANRLALSEFLNLNFGRVSKDSAGQPVSVALFRGTAVSALGILAQVNIAPLPGAWQAVISETFLKKSTQASSGTILGNRNLWIQDRLPNTLADFDGINTPPSNAEVLSNPVCVAGKGA